MQPHLEIEYKTSLTRDQYQQLIHHFPFVGPVMQFNTYYDTDKAVLQKQGIVCRVRKEGETLLFTLKEPKHEGILEYEFIMTDELPTQRKAQEILLPFQVGLADLKEITFSNTVRFTYKDVYGTWCLDATQFPHHKDYELEYELHQEDSRARNHFLLVLNGLGIEYKESPAKFLRALASDPSHNAE